MNKINAKSKKPLNQVCYEVSKVKHYSVADAVEQVRSLALDSRGYQFVDEDGTPFSAFFLGENSRCTIRFAQPGFDATGQYNTPSFNDIIDNSVFVLEWYKMDSKYEINCYFS